MCERYVLVNRLDVIEHAFNADGSEIRDRYKINPNVSLGDEALVITDEAPQKLQLMTFGFTPYWSKNRMSVLNARSEGDHNQENDPKFKGAKGIIQKPMWRKSIRSRRCLIIANAFITGTSKEGLEKPYFVYRVNAKRPFAFAGVWDEWVNEKNGGVERGFAIITTAATPLLELIPYHRSPLILSQDDERRWIDRTMPLHVITDLLTPFDDDGFNAYPIATGIKSTKRKNKKLIEPLKEEWVRREYRIIIEENLELQGMGQTTARRRKLREEEEEERRNRRSGKKRLE